MAETVRVFTESGREASLLVVLLQNQSRLV